MKLIFQITLLLAVQGVFSTLTGQSVGINADGVPPHASALLDLQSEDKGLLIPRMTSDQRMAIPSPASGLFVFDTSLSAENKKLHTKLEALNEKIMRLETAVAFLTATPEKTN